MSTTASLMIHQGMTYADATEHAARSEDHAPCAPRAIPVAPRRLVCIDLRDYHQRADDRLDGSLTDSDLRRPGRTT